MSAADVVAAGRLAAESLMLDSCLVRRPAGESTDALGNVTPLYSLIYEGKCRLQSTIAQGSNPEAGDHSFTVEELVWSAPFGAGPFKINDSVTYVSAALDPDLAGSVYRIIGLGRKTAKTAQRFRVEVVSG